MRIVLGYDWQQLMGHEKGVRVKEGGGGCIVGLYH